MPSLKARGHDGGADLEWWAKSFDQDLSSHGPDVALNEQPTKR